MPDVRNLPLFMRPLREGFWHVAILQPSSLQATRQSTPTHQTTSSAETGVPVRLYVRLISKPHRRQYSLFTSTASTISLVARKKETGHRYTWERAAYLVSICSCRRQHFISERQTSTTKKRSKSAAAICAGVAYHISENKMVDKTIFAYVTNTTTPCLVTAAPMVDRLMSTVVGLR